MPVPMRILRWACRRPLEWVLGAACAAMISGIWLASDGLDAQMRIRRSATLPSLALVVIAGVSCRGPRWQRKFSGARRDTRELARREAPLRQLADQATDLIRLHDAQLRDIYVNAASRTMLGREPSSLIGERFGSIAHEEDVPKIEAALAALAREGHAQRFVFRERHADGGVRWLETEMVVLVGAVGMADSDCHYVSISRDVTDRLENEKALSQTRERLDAVLRLGPGLLYRACVGPDGERRTAVMSDCALAHRLGYTAGQLSDPSLFRRCLHPEDTVQEAVAVETCLRTGQATAEYRFRGSSGEWHWLHDDMCAGELENGQSMLVGYLTDVTAEREAKERIRRLERLATLGEVASGIAHEVNQPLASISIAADNGADALARDPPGLEAAIGKFRRVREQARRISTIMDHIRRLGRTDNARREPVRVSAVLHEALQLLEPRLKAAGVKLELELEDGLPEMRGDAVLIEQVIVNIVVNACDAYCEHLEITPRPLRLAARRDGARVRLAIADRAGGISATVLPRIFDPFFTTKPVGKGSGLGLSLSLAMVTEMGGELTARNEAGGACFALILPAAAEAAVSAANAWAARPLT